MWASQNGLGFSLSYILCYLSAVWLQLQEIEQSPNKVSVDNGISLKNTGDQVQLEYLIIRLVNYSVTTSLIYKYNKKEKLGGFSI